MVDIMRRYQPALAWLASLSDAPGIVGYVVMELMHGCESKREMSELQTRITPFRVYWPTEIDCNRAIDSFAHAHLSHSLGILDALIGACAVGMNATLCTFNARHFAALADLVIEQPYAKT